MNASERIKAAAKYKGYTVKSMCEQIGIKYRTVQHYLAGRTPNADFLIQMNEKMGISADWLLTGNGQMLLNNDHNVAEKRINYDVDVVCHQADSRAGRLCQCVRSYLNDHGEDEAAWLEIQLKKDYPEIFNCNPATLVHDCR